MMRCSGYLACLALLLVAAVPGLARAGETGHYVSGVEGIRAASLPPPGLYLRAYAVSYQATELIDGRGDRLDLDFDLDILALVNRIVWISERKILGGFYGADIILPVIATDLEIRAFGAEDSQSGLGDVAVEPLVLSWPGSRYDASFGVAFYLPTGDYEVTEPASPGKDFWTGMLTLGGTCYLDRDRAWSASILARFEVHTEKRETEVRPGNDFHFEWGLGRTFAKVWSAGLTGYGHWQVTDDRGADVFWDRNLHDRVMAAGPEVNVFFPEAGLLLSLRSQWEFDARDRSEGQVTTFTLTKGFGRK